MSFKPTIIVLILAAASAALAFYVHTRSESAAARAAQNVRVAALETIPVDDVSRITLRRGDAQPLVYERSEGRWMQTEPIDYPVDPFSLRQLPATAAQLRVFEKRTLDPADPDAAAILKLDPPAAVLTLHWPDGERTITLGRRGVAGRAFLRVGGGAVEDETVYVVSPELHERAIAMNPWEWRDRQLFHDVSIEASRIDRRVNDQLMTLERDNRRWQMTDPVSTRTDSAAVEQLIDGIARVRLSGFVADHTRTAEDLAPYGLNEPVGSLTIITRPPGQADAAAESQTLLLGGSAGLSSQDRYAMIDGRDVVFQLSATAVIELFARPAAQYVDPTGSGVNPADVQSFILRRGGDEHHFRRDFERWVTVPASESAAIVEVPYTRVERLLQHLTQLRAARVDLLPFPRELEVASVSFYARGGQPLDTVRIAHDPQSDEWALENGDDVLRVFTGEFRPPIDPIDFGLE